MYKNKISRTAYYTILATIVMMKGLWDIDVGAGCLIIGCDLVGFTGEITSATATYHLGLTEVVVAWLVLLYLTTFHDSTIK